jgi:hypothetical protein
MPVAKKKTTSKRAKKTPPKVMIVTKTYHTNEESLFPEKVAKVKEVLSKSDFRPS